MTNQLIRSTSLSGALILGLGSILGTGAYVSVGLSAEIVGPYLLIAIMIAALTALFNGLSSAQLAAVHPVSGGTYEYGYRFLNPTAGVVAGSLFVVAKSASAATAALAVAWYLELSPLLTKLVAVILLLIFTGFVLAGVKRTNRLNILLVTISVLGLLVFAWLAYISPSQTEQASFAPDFSLNELLYAAALMFVAFTGYGRIATMGEEVLEPRKTIPKAIVLTLAVTTLLYLFVGVAILITGRAEQLAAAEFNISQLVATSPWHLLVVIGGAVAMCGVVLNLILGVSRVVLAMGRRGDLPLRLATLDSRQTGAPAATWVTFAIMALLVLVGNIKAAWTMSAFTVLVYYGLTNLAALKVSPEQRFVPKWVSLFGLICCLALALFVPATIMLGGVLFIALVAIVHKLRGKA